MATIVTRAGKGSPLTHNEVDANFENLNSDKVETSSVSAFGATLIDDADAATARTTLGLGTAATTASTDYATAAQGALADSAVQPNDSPTFGNISVTGTVDGRDVAADGTKLDGIEAGATADQTASEILTAITTVDGAGSGLDADLLDGQQGSYYLNTSTTFGGDVSGTYNAIVVADDSHNHIIANVDGLQTALDGKASTSHNHTLDSLSNTTITSNTSGEILKWNGTAWVNNTLAEAGIQPAGSYLTGNQTITLSGDATGSGTTSIVVTVADDSHNHIISNVDGLQTALDGKLNLSGGTMTGGLTFGAGVTLTEATDRPDLLKITSSTSTWGGIQISNTSNEFLWSFMGNGTTGGIYDDLSNAWHIQFVDGGATTLYHAGAAKIATSTTGATVTGTAVADTFNATSTTNGGFQGIDADTATTPSFTWTADLNTGIYRPAADTLSVTTAGAQRFTVGPAGQIGVGGASYGSSGQVLTSNGTGSAPSWQNAGGGIGVGQSWQTVSRTHGTTYQNTTGKPIQLFFYANEGSLKSTSLEISANNSTWVLASYASRGTSVTIERGGSPIVPPNHYYRATGNGSGYIESELR